MIIETRPHSIEETNEYLEGLLKETEKFRCLDCKVEQVREDMQKIFQSRNEGLCKRCWNFDMNLWG